MDSLKAEIETLKQKIAILNANDEKAIELSIAQNERFMDDQVRVQQEIETLKEQHAKELQKERDESMMDVIENLYLNRQLVKICGELWREEQIDKGVDGYNWTTARLYEAEGEEAGVLDVGGRFPAIEWIKFLKVQVADRRCNESVVDRQEFVERAINRDGGRLDQELYMEIESILENFGYEHDDDEPWWEIDLSSTIWRHNITGDFSYQDTDWDACIACVTKCLIYDVPMSEIKHLTRGDDGLCDGEWVCPFPDNLLDDTESWPVVG